MEFLRQNVPSSFFLTLASFSLIVGGDYDPEFAETAGLPADSQRGEGRPSDVEGRDGSSSPTAGVFWEPAFTLSADRRRSR